MIENCLFAKWNISRVFANTYHQVPVYSSAAGLHWQMEDQHHSLLPLASLESCYSAPSTLSEKWLSPSPLQDLLPHIQQDFSIQRGDLQVSHKTNLSKFENLLITRFVVGWK